MAHWWNFTEYWCNLTAHWWNVTVHQWNLTVHWWNLTVWNKPPAVIGVGLRPFLTAWWRRPAGFSRFVAFKIVIRMRKVIHLYQLSMYLHSATSDLVIYTFFWTLFFRRFGINFRPAARFWGFGDPRQILDNSRRLFKGFSKAEAGLEMDLERF